MSTKEYIDENTKDISLPITVSLSKNSRRSDSEITQLRKINFKKEDNLIKIGEEAKKKLCSSRKKILVEEEKNNYSSPDSSLFDSRNSSLNKVSNSQLIESDQSKDYNMADSRSDDEHYDKYLEVEESNSTERNHNNIEKYILKERLNADESVNSTHQDILSSSQPTSPSERNLNIFGESTSQRTSKLKGKSLFNDFETYKIFTCIVKSGEDLRQEQFATQLISEYAQIFEAAKVKCWLNTYEIISTGPMVGIIQVVENAISLDEFKKRNEGNSINEFFNNMYRYSPELLKKVKMNFVRSLAGYSLVCYFLQIKDRHNGNILIDKDGHLIHIDFGFMISNSPGNGMQFEKAPFKLTNEFVDFMDGVGSKYFQKFRKLLWKGFLAVVNNYEKILIMVEMMFCGHGGNLPCFQKGQLAIDEMKARFVPRKNMKNHDYIELVDQLIEASIDNWRTKWYDKYQYYFQGIVN